MKRQRKSKNLFSVINSFVTFCYRLAGTLFFLLMVLEMLKK